MPIATTLRCSSETSAMYAKVKVRLVFGLLYRRADFDLYASVALARSCFVLIMATEISGGGGTAMLEYGGAAAATGSAAPGMATAVSELIHLFQGRLCGVCKSCCTEHVRCIQSNIRTGK